MSDAIKISKNYSFRPSDPGHIIDDQHAGVLLPKNDLGTKILIYKDRVEGWFLDFAALLLRDGDADYVVLQIAIAQIEGMQQFRDGERSEGNSPACFARGLRAVLGRGKHDDVDLEDFYNAIRCGLFHNGFTKGAAFVSRGYPEAFDLVTGQIRINPEKLFDAVKKGFARYIELLGDESNGNLRASFQRVWDDDWREAKSGLNEDQPMIWPAESPPSGSAG